MMRPINVLVCAVVLLSGATSASAQELWDQPIRFELGGTPGGGLFLTGGDDDTEVNFNVYTFSAVADYYVTQRVALEGEYMWGNGWGQDIVFRNGLVIGQQLPFSNAFTGGLLYFPKGTTGTRLPFYIGGGFGLMSLVSRPTTTKIGYDPDVTSRQSFMLSRIGAGIKIPRGAAAPNWAFRLDYRLMFINPNDDAPEFFAHQKTRTGHQVQFGIQYAFRR
jgi:opacity protein-like surface antigen